MEQKKVEESKYQYQPIMLPSTYFKQYNIPNCYIQRWNRIWAITFVLGFIAYFFL